jgi:site-specific DNA-methyltransferase (adenine-specific)
MPLNRVFNIDCNLYMKDIPDKYYELAIVDPPYGIGDFTEQSAKKRGKTKPIYNVYWNNEIPDENYFSELKRVSKNQIIWGANYYNSFSKLGGAVIWDKGNINPVYSKCEIASLSFQKRVDYINIDWQSGFIRKIYEDKTIHPCQKPVALYKWLLQHYAKPNDKIFDSHVGSGSSRIACYELGFDFEGTELDLDYFNAQEERFKLEKARIDGKFYLPCSEKNLFTEIV